jgi:hypothetical protein
MTKKEKIEKEILETLKNDKKDIYGSILYFIEKLKKIKRKRINKCCHYKKKLGLFF